MRIWTDYIRLNRTHLWSYTAKHWWNIFNQQDVNNNTSRDLRDSVTFNGYRKIKNFSFLKKSKKSASCACVVNLQLKWQLKYLIIAFVASVLFAIAGVFNIKTAMDSTV